MAEIAYFFKLWKGHLKRIEGHFGTGVLSYFLFLKWLFYINIPVFVFTFGFVILPQVLYRYLVQTPCCYAQNVTFTGKELLTGSVSLSVAQCANHFDYLGFLPKTATNHTEIWQMVIQGCLFFQVLWKYQALFSFTM